MFRLWKLLVVCCLLFIQSETVLVRGEEQIKWTPNEDSKNAPLPLSRNQREQLLKLQQTIEQSPDPNKVLQQVAEANQMSPQDLVNMMDKNMRDLQQDPSLMQATTTTIPRMMLKAAASISLTLSQIAKKYPQLFSLTAVALVLVLYTLVAIPRSGLVLSSRRRGLLSKGPTTLVSPPTKYLQKYVNNAPRLDRVPLSIKVKKTKWDDLNLKQDGVELHDLERKSELKQAVTAQVSLKPKTVADHVLSKKSKSHDFDEEDPDILEDILELLFESAAEVLSSRQLTEFVDQEESSSSSLSKLKFVASSEGRQKYGILSVPGLGDWKRYGLVPLQVTRQLESDKDASLTYATLAGGPFDGQLHFSVQKYRHKIVVRVHTVVPKKGKKLAKVIAPKLVETLAQSIAKSTETRAQQILARRAQSKSFQHKAKSRAQERRKNRFSKEKEIEEMAEDRRRRWQRANPDAGRYRPSGDRQRSPNAATWR